MRLWPEVYIGLRQGSIVRLTGGPPGIEKAGATRGRVTTGAAQDEMVDRRPRPWSDAREWLVHVDALGELRVARGVDWQSGIGAVTELLDHADDSPCVLFDEIPGYPAGRRVLVNCNGTPLRQSVTF